MSAGLRTRGDLRPEEYDHPLGYLFKPGPKSQRTRRLIRLFLKQDGRCFYCECDMAPYGETWESMSLDHVIPRVRGGSPTGANAAENSVAACRSCNVAKDDLSKEEFLARLKARPQRSDPWSQHTAEMIEYARRLARGEAEDIPETRPRLKWWQGHRLEEKPAPYDGGYRNAPSDYRRPVVL